MSKMFHEGPLLSKLDKLIAEHQTERLLPEVLSRVPDDRLSEWLWDAFRRRVLPDDYLLRDLVAAHVDKVPIALVASALSNAQSSGEGEMLPGVTTRAFWMLFACCNVGKTDYLRAHARELPRPLERAAWCTVSAVAKTPPPDDITSETREMLPDHVLGGRMDGLDLSFVCAWMGIDTQDLYEPIMSRLDEVDRIHLLTFGCLLYRTPKDALVSLLDRVIITGVQPSWMAWWMNARRGIVDTPVDNLEVFEALRLLLEREPDWMRLASMDQVGLGVAQALIAAGHAVPEALLETAGGSSSSVERWLSVYRTLPLDRLKRLYSELQQQPAHEQAALLRLAPLLGPEYLESGLDETERALLNGECTDRTLAALGAIGAPIVEILSSRIDLLTSKLPKKWDSREFKKFDQVVALRSALAVALGEMASSGQPIAERFDEYWMPTRAVYGARVGDYIYRFFSSDLRKLLAALPDERVRRFLEAWLLFDRAGRYGLDARFKAALPSDKLWLLNAGPSQAAQLQALAFETGLDCSLAVYALVPDLQRRAGTLNTVGAIPRGLERDDWPRIGSEAMEPVLTLDLAGIPELQARWPSARALCLFVDRPSTGFVHAELHPLDEAACAAGLTETGRTFTSEKIMVPPEVFGRKKRTKALKMLREGLDALPARALGMPTFIQESEETSSGFVLQADEWFSGLNLGDSGELYVFEHRSFWQSC